MLTFFNQQCFHWVGRIRKIDDSRIPTDILYDQHSGRSRCKRIYQIFYRFCKYDIELKDMSPAFWRHWILKVIVVNQQSLMSIVREGTDVGRKKNRHIVKEITICTSIKLSFYLPL